MTKAAETQAQRIRRRLNAVFPATEGYDVVVYVEGYSIVSSVVRDESIATIYVGDKWPVQQAVDTIAGYLVALDRDDDGRPARDDDGKPLDVSFYQ